MSDKNKTQQPMAGSNELPHSSPFNEPGAAQRFESILHDIVDQEVAAKAAAEQAKFKGAGGFFVSSRDLLKIALLLLVGWAWLRIYHDQEDIRGKKKIHDDHKTVAAKLGISDNDESGNAAASQDAKTDKYAATEPAVPKSANEPKLSGFKALAAKIVSSAVGEGTSFEPDRDWQRLLKCSTNAVWGSFQSPTFLRVSDNMLVGYRANQIFVYSPFYVGFEQAYSGFFWQRPIVKLARIMPLNLDEILEFKYFALPVQLRLNDNRYQAHAYLALRRDGRLSFAAPTTLGDAVEKNHEHSFVGLHSENLIWDSVSNPTLDKHAVQVLLHEVELQILRYERAKGNGLTMFIGASENPLAYELGVYGACFEAGKYYHSAILKNAAAVQLTLLQEKGAAIARSSFAVDNVAASNAYPTEFVTAQSLLNRSGYESCARDFPVRPGAVLPVKLDLQSDGQVATADVSQPSGLSNPFTQCFKSHLMRWHLPQPDEALPVKIKFNLVYR